MQALISPRKDYYFGHRKSLKHLEPILSSKGHSFSKLEASKRREERQDRFEEPDYRLCEQEMLKALREELEAEERAENGQAKNGGMTEAGALSE